MKFHSPNSKSALIILFSVLASHTHAQVFEWAWSSNSFDVGQGFGIAADDSGNVYGVGEFNGTQDFNPDDNENFSMNAINGNGYVLKLDHNGAFVWAFQLDAYIYYIEVMPGGEILIAGQFSGSTDFDPGTGNAIFSGASGASFLMKYTPVGEYIDGNAVVMTVEALAVDSQSNIYLGGGAPDGTDILYGNDVYIVSGPAM